MIPGSANPLLLRSAAATGYSISRSLRFNSSDSAYLSRTPASAGNRKTWTWAGWVKRSALGSRQNVFGTGDASFFNGLWLEFFSDNTIRLGDIGASALDLELRTSQVFRDPSSWGHLVVAVDTTQGTNSNRIKIYWNSSQITAFSTATYPTQNFDTRFNTTAAHGIGRAGSYNAQYFNGYLADIHFIDGQALDPTSFGEFDATTGVWMPKAYTGSYGTNGFQLKFADNSSNTATTLGKDTSGNGNNWTPVNLLASATNYGDAVTSTPYGGSASAVLDQDLTNFVRVATSNYGTSFWTVNFSTPIPIASSVVCRIQGESGASNMFRIRINDTTNTIIPAGSGQQDLTLDLGGATTLSQLDFRTYAGSGYGANLYYIQVDGKTIYTGSLASQVDSLVDVPTNGAETDTGTGGEVKGNYCTLNPLDNPSSKSLVNGNLEVIGAGNTFHGVRSSMGVTTGKWYFECTVAAEGGETRTGPGLYRSTDVLAGDYGNGTVVVYDFSGVLYVRDESGAGPTWYSTAGTVSAGDLFGFAFDLDAAKVWIHKNGTWLNSGNPGAGTGAVVSSLPSGTYFPGGWAYNTSDNLVFNFGQRAFAYNTNRSDFKALNTANLGDPVVTKPSTVMDVALWTGNGSARSITGLAFYPDLVWIKGRSGATDHALYDAVRGVQIDLVSNSTAAETTQTQGLTAFNSDGFSLGTLAKVNTSSATYAGWAWDAGSSTVTNTQGSITSQVRANASAGFSIATYTGTGATGSVGHGLGVTPGMIIVKARATTTNNDWMVYHSGLANPPQDALRLNRTNTPYTNNTYPWNSSVTSTVFGVSPSSSFGISSSSITYVAYCFAPVAGYSSFNRYTGNGSADGPFVFLGFRPALVMVKMYSSTGNWTILDDKREGYNVDNDPLFPNLSNAEGTTDLIDITSNGFKVRTTDVTFNTNAGTYIYAAWASSPFAYSRAR